MADEQKQIIRRAPAVPKKISDLKPEMGRVCLAGTIISKNKDIGSFILDDGENKILILTNDPKEFEQLREGTFIRVMGKVWGQEGELEIQADIIQDFSKIDKELYKKVVYTKF